MPNVIKYNTSTESLSLKKKNNPIKIAGISTYKLSGIKNDTIVKIRPDKKIPDRIFPEIPFKFSPINFSSNFPQPIKVEMTKNEENKIDSIKKDCLKISNLSCF